MIFRGTFDHALDAKHRLTVPVKFRGPFKSGVVLTMSPPPEPDMPRSLGMWVPEDFESYMEAALEGHNRMSATYRVLSTTLFANSQDLEMDAANRVMIPQNMMDFAGLDKEVVVIGVGQSLEIWDRPTYTAYNERALTRFSEITAGFDHTA